MRERVDASLQSLALIRHADVHTGAKACEDKLMYFLFYVCLRPHTFPSNGKRNCFNSLVFLPPSFNSNTWLGSKAAEVVQLMSSSLGGFNSCLFTIIIIISRAIQKDRKNQEEGRPGS